MISRNDIKKIFISIYYRCYVLINNSNYSLVKIIRQLNESETTSISLKTKKYELHFIQDLAFFFNRSKF
jgi:hypothetical protein